MNIIPLGDIGFEALMAKPDTLTSPSIGDLYSLWGVYKAVTGASNWKVGLAAVIKGPSFRAQFKAFAKLVAAIDSLMDDQSKVVEVQSTSTGLLS